MDVSGKGITGGAEIGALFYDEIAKEINSAIRDFDEKEMLVVLANLSGFRHQNRLFPDDLAMEKAVRDLTEEYKTHLRNSVDMIKDIVEKTVEKSANLILDGYPGLITAVLDLMNDKISRNQDETKKLVESFIEAHRAFINYNHPHFIEARMNLGMEGPPVPKQISSTSPRKNKEPLTESNISADADKELHRGALSLMTSGFRTSGKPVFVVLMTKRLTIYKDESHLEVSIKISEIWKLNDYVSYTSYSILDKCLNV